MVVADVTDEDHRYTLRPDQIETLEEMVEALVALCDCPEVMTGQVNGGAVT